MNIYLHELSMYRKSTLVWSLAIVALVVVMLAMFPAFAQDAAGVQKILQGYPAAVRQAIGLNLSTITSFLGFYSFIYLYVMLCGAIQAMNLGTSILSQEVRDKTADFLLTKPVTRQKIMTAKILAALTCLVLTNICFFAAATIMARAVNTASYSRQIFLLLTATVFLVQLMFLTLGILISVLMPKIKSVLSISLGTVFGLFILNMFGSTLGDTTLRYLTPFKYYDPAYIIKHSAYETSFVVVEILFIVVAISASYFLYARKDINPV
ncbi:MAG: ABC transporter permease subunit [Peptococcaceae bacterium]|nr:ABC transporter permease subunit [Peptococcaceae bacterium]